MSDIGNESASVYLRFLMKFWDSFCKLVKYTMEHKDRKLEREFKRVRIQQMRNQQGSQGKDVNDLSVRNLYKEYIRNKRGYIQTKQFFKDNEKLYPLGMAFTKKQLERFDELTKMAGIKYTTMKDNKIKREMKEVDSKLKELDTIAKEKGLTEEQLREKNNLLKKRENLEKEKENVIVIVRPQDLEMVKLITEKMLLEQKFEENTSELDNLYQKGKENWTEEDKKRAEELENEQEEILYAETDNLNRQENDNVFTENTDIERKNHSFEQVIETVDGKAIEGKAVTSYICDKNNPNNYIEVVGLRKEREQRNKDGINEKVQYSETTYNVFKDGEKQTCEAFKDSHGEFRHNSSAKGTNSSTKGEEYWNSMKTQMNGVVGNELYVFKTKEEFEKYKQEVNKMQEEVNHNKEESFTHREEMKTELKQEQSAEKQEKMETNVSKQEVFTKREDTIGVEYDTESFKDCDGMINQLKGQLSDHNLALNEKMQMQNTSTKQVVVLGKNATTDEKMEYASDYNTLKQMDVYQQMKECQDQYNAVSKLDNSEVKTKTLEDLGEKHKELSDKLSSLEKSRIEIEQQKVYENIQSQDYDLGKEEVQMEKTDNIVDSNYQSMAQWSEDVSKAQNSFSTIDNSNLVKSNDIELS